MPKKTIKNGKKESFIHRVMERMSEKSYGELFGIWLQLAFGFALFYWGLSFMHPNHAPNFPEGHHALMRLLDGVYFSIITATSTGYGDITPQGVSKIVTCIQSICALLVFAIFVTKLVSHRQEAALNQVHRLSFEDVFHNIREGLFIIRKDFDHIIETAQGQHRLTKDHWEDMVVAFRQGQNLLQEIPDFYDAEETHLYTIDARREQIMQEAVHRTLHRIDYMLDVLCEEDIDWIGHEEVMKELTELIHVIEHATQSWRERSPYNAHEAFEDILSLREAMHSKVMEATA